MTENPEIQTNYYEFKGQFFCNGEILDAEWAETFMNHLFVALDIYESDGFRFVDVSGHSERLGKDGGFAAIEWSDYGIQDIVEDKIADHVIRKQQPWDAHERNQ